MPLDYENIPAYRISLELVRFVANLEDTIRGNPAGAREQLVRACQAVPLYIAEGVGAPAPDERRRCFDRARQSALRVAGAMDVLVATNAIPAAAAAAGWRTVSRISSSLDEMDGPPPSETPSAGPSDTAPPDAPPDSPPEEKERKRVFLVDAQNAVRRGITLLIGEEPDLAVCGQAAGASEAMRGIQETNPDIVLADIALDGLDGLELIRDLKAARPDLPTLVFSAEDETRYAQRAVEAGARGYVMKNRSARTLLDSLRSVLRGRIALSALMTQRFIDHVADGTPLAGSRPQEVLTDRELEVFHLVGHGLQTAEIAEKTVRKHQENVRGKLSLGSPIQLHQAAYAWAQSGGAL